MNEEQVHTETEEEKRQKKPFPLSDIFGRRTIFYCTVNSGTSTVEGVPINIFPDPDGRHLVQLFSSDGSRVFLYLDQVASFHTQEQVKPPKDQQGPLNLNMEQGPPTSSSTSMQGEYYQPLGEQGQPVDEIYYRAGRDRGHHVRRTERVDK